MKKITFFLTLTIGLFAFISCQNQNPIKFNDEIVDLHDSMAQVQSDFDSKLQDAIQTDSYGNIGVAADSALVKVDANIEKLKSFKIPNGGKKLVETTMALCQSVKNTINAGLKFASLTPDEKTGEVSEDIISPMIKEYNELSEKTYLAEVEMFKAQEVFAKENGFELSK